MSDDDLRGLRRLDRPTDADPAFAEELFARLRAGDARPSRATAPLLLAATLVLLVALVGGTLAVGSGLIRLREVAPDSMATSDVHRLPWWQFESFENDDRFAGGVIRIGYTDGTTTAQYHVGPEDAEAGSFSVSAPAAGFVAMTQRQDGRTMLQYVRIADGREEVFDLGPDVGVLAVTLAPDASGVYLAAVDPDTATDLGIWWLERGITEPVHVTSPSGRTREAYESHQLFTWTPDGSRLFVQRCSMEAACSWDVIGHPARSVTELSPEGTSTIAGLANRYLLARTLDCEMGPCPFLLVDLEGGAVTRLSPGVHEATLAETPEGPMVVTDTAGVESAPVTRARLLPDGQERVVYDGGGLLISFPERFGLAPPLGWIVVHDEHGIARETSEAAPRLVRLADGAEVTTQHLDTPIAAQSGAPNSTAPPGPTTPGAPATPIPALVELEIGDMAGVVADEPLVLRTAPGTGADSEILDTGMLHQGQRARVVDGPVSASGYAWYLLRVGQLEGWVAGGSREGDPWLTRVSNGRIAFSRAESVTEHGVYTVAPDGTDEELLVDLGAMQGNAEPPVVLALSCAYAVRDLAWRPAGDALVFTVPVGECQSEIHLVDVFGAEHVVAEGSLPEWSPDGSRIAFAPSVPFGMSCISGQPCGPEGTWEIRIMAAQRGAEPERVPHAGGDVIASEPSWSPDASRIAYTARPASDIMSSSVGIFVAELETASHYRLTDGTNPVWSPDGTRILFERSVEGGASSEIWVIDVDGRNETLLAEGFDAKWSPDGSTIAYRQMDLSSGATQSEIRLIDADGSNDRLLTDGWAFDWSPDGTMLVLGGDPTTGAIHVINVDGTGETRIAEGEGPAWQPRWEGPLPVP